MYGDLALTALSRLLLAALSGLLALLAGLLLSAAALLSALAAVLATLAALLLAGLLFVRIVHGYSLVLPPQPTTNPRRLSSCAGLDAGDGTHMAGGILAPARACDDYSARSSRHIDCRCAAHARDRLRKERSPSTPPSLRSRNGLWAMSQRRWQVQDAMKEQEAPQSAPPACFLVGRSANAARRKARSEG
jgi:hypothetical protein